MDKKYNLHAKYSLVETHAYNRCHYMNPCWSLVFVFKCLVSKRFDLRLV